MKERKEFEKYAYGVIKKYQKILLLDKHTIRLQYGVESEDSMMECKFRYPYLDARLNYSDRIIKKWKSKEDTDFYIVHEMCHILTDPFYAKAVSRYLTRNEIEDERENLTDHISQIILKNNI